MATAAKKTEDKGLKERPPTREEIDSAAHAATAIAIAMELDGGLNISGENGEAVKIAAETDAAVARLRGE